MNTYLFYIKIEETIKKIAVKATSLNQAKEKIKKYMKRNSEILDYYVY